jgi:hypothetical protein
MVKAIGLKSWCGVAKSTPKLPLPKCDPWLDRDVNVCRRTKEVDVIRHDNVGADHPSIGLFPGSYQRVVHNCVRKILLAVSRTSRRENDRCPMKEDENAFGWVLSLFELRTFLRLDRVSPYQVRATR